MRLTIVRHTCVDVPAGFIYGQTDVPLATTFEKEAAEVLKKLEGISFDVVYSSPLTRCRLLAEKITQSHPVIFDNRLKEMNFGIWEGEHWNTIESTSEATKWFLNYLEVACPEGESYSILIKRIHEFLNELKSAKIENCCVVTHGGPIRAFLSIIEKQSPQTLFDRKIEYGEVIQIEILKG